MKIRLWASTSAPGRQLLPTLHDPAVVSERLSFRISRICHWHPKDGVAIVIRVVPT